MTYIAIIGPMGSGKTTLAQELYNRLPDSFNLILNTEHEVFEWPCYLGKHTLPEMTALIQASMQENHFHQIFGTFLQDKQRNVISDSAFIEHRFYNNAKHSLGKYPQNTHTYLNLKHKTLNRLLPNPDIVIRLKTKPKQIIKNIQKRNRRGERDRDMTAMLEYVTELNKFYDMYTADIDYEFNSDIDALVEKFGL